MFTVRRIKSFCLMVIISVLLMGMCQTGIVADSFFSFSYPSTVTFSNEDVTAGDSDIASLVDLIVPRHGRGIGIRSTSSTTTRTLAYTHQVVPEYETTITPVRSLRRISMRHGGRDYYATIYTFSLSSVLFGYSGNHTGRLFDEIVSNTVIVSYIHHQDGAKDK